MINLKELQKEGDALADEVIAKYLDSKTNKKEVLLILDQLQKNRDPVPENLPDMLKDYFHKTAKMPEWADMKKIKMGQKIFSLYGPQIVMLLGFKSLPMAYSIPNGARLLVMTGRLNLRDNSRNTLTRRILETTQFVLDVLAPEGFTSKGRAIRSSQKVRLIHAAIRYYMKKSNDWKSAWGVPINQEYMLGTLLSFSALALDGLKQVGAKLTSEQEEAYIHTWNVIGHYLGIEDKYLQHNYKDADAVGWKIFNTESGISPDGKVLTKALLDYYDNIIPGNVFDGMSQYMLEYFAGKETAKKLGVVNKENLENFIRHGALKLLFDAYNDLEKVEFVRKITEKYSHALLEGMVYSLNGNKGINFSIPPSLTADWKVRNYWENKRTLAGPFAGWRVVLQKAE